MNLLYLFTINQGFFYSHNLNIPHPFRNLFLDRKPDCKAYVLNHLTCIFYGLLSMVIIYAVCIPLGIVKAIKHRSFMDTFSSVVVFSGYAVPGYVLGAFLLLIFGFQLDWLPLSGFRSENYEAMSFAGQVKDLFYHAIMPLCCYLVGSFAFMTMMMKKT